MMRAAIYARYSSDAQRATSIEDQERNCRRAAEAQGWKVATVYADMAISGTTKDRPQYKAMVDAAMRHEFEVLLLDDLSRFARDSVEQEQTIRRLEFSGLRIVATSDGYDSNSKAKKIHRAMKGIMNEQFIDDLSVKVHRGQTGQALKKYWNGGRPYGYALKAIRDSSKLDPYGEPARIGTVLQLDPIQAPIVREIFDRYVAGASCLTVARELNARGVPSPGSTWNRKVRRCRGWMQSAIRVILKNPLYTGQQRWNTTQFVKNPDTDKHLRRARPKSEWVTHQVDELQIVSRSIFEAAQARSKVRGSAEVSLKSGGKATYLLSGLLVCEVCGAHYVLADRRSYACSGHWNGRACTNTVRVRRDSIEETLLRPMRDEVLAPARVKKMAEQLREGFARHVAEQNRRQTDAPLEIRDLRTRIARLRTRMAAGDPDMPGDEIAAAIERAEGKLRQLVDAQPAARQTARILAMLPKAAEEIRNELDAALAGDQRSRLRMRAIMRQAFKGRIALKPEADGSLWASFDMDPAVLVRTAGTRYRGDRI